MSVKKTFCIILILSMSMILLLSSCADNTENTDTVTTITTAEKNQTDGNGAVVETASGFVPENANYDGYKFRMLGYDSYKESWRAAEISEIFAEEETGEPINDAIYKRNRIVEDLYNIEIALVPVSYGDRGAIAGTALRSIYAGEDAYDAALTIGHSLPSILSKSTQTVNLFSIPGLDLTASWWDQNSVDELSIAKELRVVTGDLTLYSAFASGMFYANKKLIQDYGLDDPYKLVRENKWNWDSVYTMARAVSVDVNGDGVMDAVDDQFGLGVENGCVSNTVRGAGERITKKDADDIPYLAVNTERTIQAMEKVYDVVFNRDISVNGHELVGYTSMYFNYFLPKFQENRLLFMYHSLFTALSMRDIESDFAILPPPMLDESQTRYYSCINESWGSYLWIPVTNQDHTRTGTVLQALGYYSQQHVTPAFYDVTITNKVIRDEESREMLDIILKSRTYDIATIYNWNDLNEKFFLRGMRTRTNTFVSDYERSADTVIIAMEKTLNEILDDE